MALNAWHKKSSVETSEAVGRRNETICTMAISVGLTPADLATITDLSAAHMANWRSRRVLLNNERLNAIERAIKARQAEMN